MHKRLITTLVALAAACLAFAAAAVTTHGQQTRPQPTGLALEITYYEGRPPAYQAVPGPEANFNGGWFALFGRVPASQPPANSLPVQAVNIISRLENGAVRIKVSVFLGVRFQEKEAEVATYNVREGESVHVRELTRFGVVPFGVKVVHVNPIQTGVPAVLNRTASIAFINIEMIPSTLPSYKLTLRN